MALLLKRRTVLAGAAALSVMPVARVLADGHSHTVELLSKHPEDKKLRNVFLPRLLVVQPGDTVLFQSVDKGHNSVSIDGMIPDGAEEWKGGIGKDIAVTFEKPGYYGYQCVPHASVGMVGMVIVEGEGKLDNLEAAKSVKQRGKAKKVFNEIWEEAEAQGLTA